MALLNFLTFFHEGSPRGTKSGSDPLESSNPSESSDLLILTCTNATARVLSNASIFINEGEGNDRALRHGCKGLDCHHTIGEALTGRIASQTMPCVFGAFLLVCPLQDVRSVFGFLLMRKLSKMS